MVVLLRPGGTAIAHLKPGQRKGDMASGLLGNGNGASAIDARAFFDSDIPQLAGTLIDMGVLVSFGTTRDRGAISISVTHNGDWDREYFRHADEAADWLRRAVDILRGRIGIELMAAPEPAQTATRGRSRLR